MVFPRLDFTAMVVSSFLPALILQVENPGFSGQKSGTETSVGGLSPEHDYFPIDRGQGVETPPLGSRVAWLQLYFAESLGSGVEGVHTQV